jgi:NhaP-type Na+/H+ or K+/H+ antiporter
LIVFLTFSVILVTLVGQGLSLPALIRALGLAGDRGPNCEEIEARRIVLQAALEHLQESRAKDDPAFAGVYDDLAQHYRDQQENLSAAESDEDGSGKVRQKYGELTQELLGIERQVALRLRNEGRISDEVLRRLEHEIDLREARLAGGLIE